MKNQQSMFNVYSRLLALCILLSSILLFSFINDAQHSEYKIVPKKNPIEYDFSCLQDENDPIEDPIIGLGHDVEDIFLEASGIPVSIEEEEAWGNNVYETQKNMIIHNDESVKLERMLQKLTAQIKRPKGYHYSIYLLASDQLNAWTCGGKIFVTTKIYEFCQTEDEMACIIGHEINHNELGHIKKKVQKWKLMSDLSAIYSAATSAFGQKDEAHCDLTGIDLVFAAGYDACVNVQLWKRMKEAFNEGDFDPVNNLFRTHPYSASRSRCSKHHIQSNYDIDCD
jgi:predicted Zn-dependent protease